MVVDKFDVVSAVRLPHEADAPLVVHPDAVLALSVSLQGLEPVTRRRSQVLNVLSSVKHAQLAPHGRLDIVREPPNRPAVPDGLRRRALE